MSQLADLKPNESEQAKAYAELAQSHEPRTVPIANTGMHACMTCDEVWPCDVAVIMAGYRVFRTEAKVLAEITIHLAEVTKAAADVIAVMEFSELSDFDEEKRAALLERLTAAIERIKGEPA